MLSILILAAGQSRRMRGRDKHLELVDNIPCTELIARQAIATGLDVRIVVPDLIGERARDVSVPKLFAEAYSAKRSRNVMKDNKAKKHLEKAFQNLSAEMIQERAPDNEVEGWFKTISNMLD